MWIFTDCGFFSVVCKEGRPEICLRARAAIDLEEFRARHCPSLSPTAANCGTDYQYRAWASPDAVTAALASVVAALKYTNFKKRVGQTQGAGRAAVYGRVWQVLLDLEREGRTEPAKRSRQAAPRKRRTRGARGEGDGDGDGR